MEDIKILEELINASKEYHQYEGNKYYKSMENLIARYKELEETLKCTQNSWYEDTKKIEEYKKQLDLDYVDNNYISKSKVKEKIEELEQIIDYNNERKQNFELVEKTEEEIELLKELLES